MHMTFALIKVHLGLRTEGFSLIVKKGLRLFYRLAIFFSIKCCLQRETLSLFNNDATVVVIYWIRLGGVLPHLSVWGLPRDFF